ncbi:MULTISPECIES: hypothetical protein [Enterococcus]|uniref:Transposase n=2 Tax=Enterococcus TaxID=1350 RepID=A0ABV0EZQ2_9ENTE|nr:MULTISPECIES: hypothetical protein [Enterococcus]KAF1295865.1 hypothetical protein BAU18_07825 [Enterococcus diestrammenae]KAF1301574.1 hypothetical protein BAU16_08580 [Enterococcus sp. JM9B]
MSNYHQLLNQLSDLNLTCIKEILPAHLDEVAKNEQSLVDSLFELTHQEILLCQFLDRLARLV